jgi:hypothetical protein
MFAEVLCVLFKVHCIVFDWQLKAKEILDKYDEVIDGQKKESFLLGKFLCINYRKVTVILHCVDENQICR